jgi:hypothetical protein
MQGGLLTHIITGALDPDAVSQGEYGGRGDGNACPHESQPALAPGEKKGGIK